MHTVPRIAIGTLRSPSVDAPGSEQNVVPSERIGRRVGLRADVELEAESPSRTSCRALPRDTAAVAHVLQPLLGQAVIRVQTEAAARRRMPRQAMSREARSFSSGRPHKWLERTTRALYFIRCSEK